MGFPSALVPVVPAVCGVQHSLPRSRPGGTSTADETWCQIGPSLGRQMNALLRAKRTASTLVFLALTSWHRQKLKDQLNLERNSEHFKALSKLSKPSQINRFVYRQKRPNF